MIGLSELLWLPWCDSSDFSGPREMEGSISARLNEFFAALRSAPERVSWSRCTLGLPNLFPDRLRKRPPSHGVWKQNKEKNAIKGSYASKKGNKQRLNSTLTLFLHLSCFCCSISAKKKQAVRITAWETLSCRGQDRQHQWGCRMHIPSAFPRLHPYGCDLKRRAVAPKAQANTENHVQ